MSSNRIKALPLEERPRERMLKYGVENLSNEDLIAIILKTGTKSYSAKNLSHMILASIKDISNLKDLSLNSLMNIKGIGMVKAMELIAAIELGRRVYYEKKIKLKERLNNPHKIFEYFKYLINDSKQEYFYCLYLDNNKNLIDKNFFYRNY